MKIELSVIVIGYNHCFYLPPLLTSLRKNLINISNEILYIDNASTDTSVDFIKENYREVKIIKNSSNFGFAKAANKGIKKSKGEKLLILNPDVVIKKGAVGKMINFLNRHKKAACCVPKLIFPDGSLQYSCRRFPSIFTVLKRRTPLRLFLPKSVTESHLMKKWNHQEIRKIDWALGGCVMVKRPVFKKAGLFDENFFLYGEDIDWFYRLKKANLNAYYYPFAEVIHHHRGLSDKKLLSRESYYHSKSIFYFLKKYWRDIIINGGSLNNDK